MPVPSGSHDDSGVRHDGRVPELPEVEALAQFLRGRADGHAVTEVSIGAISALKTFRPPPDALVGGTVVDVQRHGKWLDLMVATPTGEPLHLVWHLSRAGWVRWSEQLSTNPVRPGKSPLALRVRLDDGSGFDLTEAGTRKRLAVHVVEDPTDVPQIATLGVEPLSDEFTRGPPGGAARVAQPAGQGPAARPGDDRGDRQRVLRRDPARRPDEPVRDDEVVRRGPHPGPLGGDPRGPHRGRRSRRRESLRPSSRTPSVAA